MKDVLDVLVDEVEENETSYVEIEKENIVFLKNEVILERDIVYN